MISWMQKHKKYLVITIWISTIAFVGAGFVGWGAYKYSSASNAVAEVGDIKITLKEMQQAYSRLYNYYNKLFQGNFDQEKAKKFGLKKAALNQLIRQALLINFAKEHGLMVSDEELTKKITSMRVFFKDGVFNKELYRNILKQNRIRPKDFEESMRKELLLAKLQKALDPKLFDLEFDTIGSSLFIGDKIAYKELDDKTIDVNVTEKELKSYYDHHKDNYLTPTYYRLSIVEVAPEKINASAKDLQEFYRKNRIKYKDDKGKILPFEKAKELVERDYKLKKAKRRALETYIRFKKGKIKPQKEMKITENDTTLPPTIMKKLKMARNGKVFKPIQKEGKYLIIRLDKKILPRTMSFEEAKSLVKNDLLNEKRAKALLKIAQKSYKNFKGITTPGYICRDDVDKLKLDKVTAAKFLKELFIQEKGNGFIKIDNHKVVLYKVLDQKLVMQPKIDKNKKLISDNGLRLKKSLQEENMIQQLQKLYPIKIYKGI